MNTQPPRAPFAHHAWLGYWDQVRNNEPRVVIHRRQVVHSLMYLARGPIQYRWVNRGVDHHHYVTVGTIRFDPATGDTNTFLGRHNPAHDIYTLLIPPENLHEIATSDEIDDPEMSRHLVVPDDAELRWCMSRLSSFATDASEAAAHHEEVARRLVLRLHRLCGGKAPEW